MVPSLDRTNAQLSVKGFDLMLRVLSYNIHKGFSLDRRFVLENIKSAIRETNADLVFLQEVLGEHKGLAAKIQNWPVSPQLEFLAESIWPHFAYGKNAVYTEGHHGNAILSRHAFRSFDNIDVSTNRFERRGLLHATLEPLVAGGSPLHLICVHLDLLERGRAQQIDRLIHRIRMHVPDEAPLIIAGDFNDWREQISVVLESALRVEEVHKKINGAHAKSFPSWFPFLQLDRMYIRGLEGQEAKCLTGPPWNQLSDHVALFARLEILPRD